MEKKSLAILATSHFVTDLNLGSLPAVLPFFVTVYGFDYKSVAGLMFASSCLSTIVQPFFGWLADKGPRHWFMGLGLLICGISFALAGFFTNYWAIFAAILLSGVGSAIFHPEAAKLVNAISGAKRGMGMSVFSVGGNGGFGAGPLLAVALITAFGLHGMAFYAIMALAVGVPLLLFSSRIKVPNEGVKPVKAAAAVAEDPQANDWKSFSKLTVFIVLRSACYTGINSFLPLYCIYSLGASHSAASATVSVLAFAGIFCTFLGGPLADRFGYAKMIRIGSLLLVPAIALAVLPHSLFWVYAMLIPISLAFNITYSPFVVLGQNFLAKSVGFASGITLGISFSAGGILAPGLGWFGDKFGIAFTMGRLVVLALAAHLISYFIPKKPAGTPAAEVKPEPAKPAA